MNIQTSFDPYPTVNLDAEMRLDIGFRDGYVLFEYLPLGILKGGKIRITYDQMQCLIFAVISRQRWQSGSSSTRPILQVRWEYEYDQLHVDMVQFGNKIELFGRVVLEEPMTSGFVKAIKNVMTP